MRVMKRLKYLIRRYLKCFGIDIYPVDFRNSVQSYLEYLFNVRGVECVVDIGANEGQYADMLLNIGFRGQIISYEPLDKPWSLLEKKAARHPNWVAAPRAAVTDSHEASVTIFETDNSVSSSVLAPLQSAEFSTMREACCPAININSVLQKYKQCQLLKLDVQGFEANLLRGIDDEASYYPKFLQLELAVRASYENEPLFESVDTILKAMGYELIFIFPGVVDDFGRVIQLECFYEKM